MGEAVTTEMVNAAWNEGKHRSMRGSTNDFRRVLEVALSTRTVDEPGEVERQRGWIYFNPDAGTEWAESHPVESGEVDDAEDIRPGTAEELLKQLLPAWRDLGTETAARETAEAALAETRERLEEAAKDALASLVAAVSLLKRSSKKAAPSDAMFDQMIVDYEASIDRTRAALTGDAQEAGRG